VAYYFWSHSVYIVYNGAVLKQTDQSVWTLDSSHREHNLIWDGRVWHCWQINYTANVKNYNCNNDNDNNDNNNDDDDKLIYKLP